MPVCCTSLPTGGEITSPTSIPEHGLHGPPSPLSAGPSMGLVGADRGHSRFFASREDGPSQKPVSRPRPVTARLRRDRAVAPEHEGAEKGCIAQLQEFVQGSKENPMPANCSILQWSYSHRMAGSNLEFRASVGFLLDGVPHHCLGTWQSSKKRAQRDVAERALCLFVTCWGSIASLQPGSTPVSDSSPQSQPAEKAAHAEAPSESPDGIEEVQALARFCGSSQAALGLSTYPQWRHNDDNGEITAFVEVELLGVAHTFSGCPKPSLMEAFRDTARRVLWYLQCPGYEHCFEPDLGLDLAKELRKPPEGWTMDEDTVREADEKKTVLMRLQNRLQQNYARQIEVGKSAICWSYERSPADKRRVRATAYIPAADRHFTGSWQAAQREAQIDACHRVSDFLDNAFPSPKRGRGRTI